MVSALRIEKGQFELDIGVVEDPKARLLTQAGVGEFAVEAGDAFDLLTQLPAKSVDLVLTSPPYWGHREYGLKHNWGLFNSIEEVRQVGAKSRGYDWYRSQGGVLGLEPYPEWYVEHLAEILTRAALPLKDAGSLWINLGDTYFARWSSIRDGGRQGLTDDGRLRRKTPLGDFRQEKQLLLIPARFAIAMQKLGWILRNDLIWYKPNAVPRPEGDRLKLSHEHFLHFVKKPKLGRAAYHYDVRFAEPRQNDVVTVNVQPGEDGHSATFPPALIEPRILTSCPPGGVVLDPFCGTGRTLESAARLGRIGLGFDAQEDFVRAARKKKGRAVATDASPSLGRGNFISEWFGQRIHPVVRLDVDAVSGKAAESCPFLSNALSTRTACVKAENSKGVCTVSSIGARVRRDWLVCPYRVIDSAIVAQSCRVIFGLDRDVQPTPVPRLMEPGELDRFKAGVESHGVGYLFFQDKLGGEISVIGTDRSPELSFDVTLVEIVRVGEAFDVSRYGILEIQTMDYHGSYAAAVRNLRDALRLHERDFPTALQNKLAWASDGIQSPNIANVFKRTFYQMMLKFKLAGEGAAAGSVLAVPRAVWESWQPFLGAPDLADIQGDGSGSAFLCIFDTQGDDPAPISPVIIERLVKVSPDTLVKSVFTEVPDHILHAISASDSILTTIRGRLGKWWTGFVVPAAPQPHAGDPPGA